MDSPCLSIIFRRGATFFGLPLLKILPILMRLLAAIVSGAVKWPGPIVHSPDPKASLGSAYYGLPSEHLFSTFISYALIDIGCGFGRLAGCYLDRLWRKLGKQGGRVYLPLLRTKLPNYGWGT
jgi:hypothetical protein